MVKCKVCGRRFRNEQALGGHMSHAHSGRQEGSSQTEESRIEDRVNPCQDGAPPEIVEMGLASPEVVEAEPASPEDEGEAAQIREYLSKGYTVDQLTSQFRFKARTVRREMEKLVPPEVASPEGKPHDDGLPVLRKMGAGVEVINPEAVLRRYMDGDDDQKELRGMMKLRAAMLMVMDLINLRKADAEAFALEVKPILDLMKETRAEQDTAAQRARASSLEAAQAAAQEALGQALPYLDERLKSLESAVQRKPDIASTPHPLQGVMARTMEGMFDQLLRAFGFGGQSGPPGQRTIPGFTYEKGGES